MQTPYDILNVARSATDAEIKQAYLVKVKSHPPELDPQQFQLIHQAYSVIKDHKSRLSHDLFTVPAGNFNGIIDQALKTEQCQPLTAEQFNALLAVSVDDSNIHSALSKIDKQ